MITQRLHRKKDRERAKEREEEQDGSEKELTYNAHTCRQQIDTPQSRYTIYLHRDIYAYIRTYIHRYDKKHAKKRGGKEKDRNLPDVLECGKEERKKTAYFQFVQKKGESSSPPSLFLSLCPPLVYVCSYGWGGDEIWDIPDLLASVAWLWTILGLLSILMKLRTRIFHFPSLSFAKSQTARPFSPFLPSEKRKTKQRRKEEIGQEIMRMIRRLIQTQSETNATRCMYTQRQKGRFAQTDRLKIYRQIDIDT